MWKYRVERLFLSTNQKTFQAMKKFLVLLSLLVAVQSVRAQDSIGLRKHYLKMYDQAIKYNDINEAIHALHGYIAVDNSLIYKDTLSMLYYSSKNYVSALILAEEVYKAVPANIDAMARAAECYDELGDPKTAVSLFEQVVPKTKNPYHIYKLAVGQYELKRNLESEASARAVLADTSSRHIGVSFVGMDGNQQAIPVNAAAANLMGVMKMDAKNFAGAKADFQQALTFYPDFAGAKQNMAVCDKNLKGGKTTTPPKTTGKTNG
jgi:tetratricopeptide (TPR) repeat protein